MFNPYKDFANKKQKAYNKMRKINGKFSPIKLRCFMLISLPINLITCGIINAITFPDFSHIALFLGGYFIVENITYYMLNLLVNFEHNYLYSSPEILIYHRFICGEIEDID